MESQPRSLGFTLFGVMLVGIAVTVFAIRLVHAGPYALPEGGGFYGALGAGALGALLVWGPLRAVSWAAVLISPLVMFPAIYSIAAESEEVISLYATDSTQQLIDLRLWIIDRDDGAWVGMPKSKALEHQLHGRDLKMLRAGEMVCVRPVLYEDRPTVRAIHRMKVEKYVVAQAAGVIGMYPQEAPDTTVALRLDACPE